MVIWGFIFVSEERITDISPTIRTICQILINPCGMDFQLTRIQLTVHMVLKDLSKFH
jgi:hypothetical protein